MSQQAIESADLLKELAAAPPGGRAALLSGAAGTFDQSDPFWRLLEFVEKLALHDLPSAQEAAYLLVNTADELSSVERQLRARHVLAYVLNCANRYEEALGVLDEALTIAEPLQNRRQLALVNLARLHALARLGRFEKAIQAGNAARAEFLKLEDQPTVARTDVNLGVVERMRDRPAEALRHFDRARAALADQRLVVAQIDSNRAEALLDLHEFEAAEASFRSALQVLDEEGAARAAAIVEGNLADLMGRQGRFGSALHYFEKAYRRLAGAPGDAARLQSEAAEVQLQMGLIDEAAVSSAEAAHVLEKQGMAAEAARARAVLGRALAILGHRAQAEHELARAADRFREIGQPQSAARVDLAKAQLLLSTPESPDADQAAAAGQLVASLLPVLRDRPADTAAAHSLMAASKLRTGSPSAALEEAAAGFRLAEMLDLAPLASELLHLKGKALVALGRADEAREILNQAIEHAERIRSSLQADRFRTAFHARRAGLYEDAVAVTLQPESPASISDAFHLVERSRSRALLDLLARGGETEWSQWSDDVQQHALLSTLARWRERLNALYSHVHEHGGGSGDRLQVQIAESQREIAAIEARLAASGRFAGLFSEPISLDEARQSLEPGTALIEYFIAGGQVLAFVLRADAPPRVHTLALLSDALGVLERLRFQISRAIARGARGANAARYREACDQELTSLHSLLLRPLLPHVKGIRRLIIAPHGPLHALPFHALTDGSEALIEKFEVVYTPSASILAELKRLEVKKGSAGALVVGAADAKAPGIEAEARAVAGILGTERLVLGEEATVGSVSAAAAGSQLIHIAAHGMFSSLAPSTSGIRLCDGWLTAREAGTLKIQGSIVTLSGCDTGRSSATAGDELLGFVRALFSAGARSILATLWPVHDEVATSLLVSTYSKWYIEGGNDGRPALSASLREAQIELLRARVHPAFWAPFFLAGTA